MSVSGISSSNLANLANYQSSTNVQNQQQWQAAFQQLGQELQTGNLSPLQTSTQTATQTAAQNALQSASPNSTSPATPVGTPASPILFNTPQGTPAHGIHARPPHRLRVDAGDDSGSDGEDSNPLGQSPSASPASAQQAYSSWQQDLQQVALNSDLLSAQASTIQPVSLSA
jgi:hypothetical protein